MSGPNNIARETLDKRLKRRQFWSEVFAWLVGGGLLIEYGQEILDCFVNFHAPSTPLIGGLLVTLGVFGEVWFSRLALNASEELQRRADSDVSQANERAAHALERATNAEQATAEANLERIKLEASFKRRTLDRKLTPGEESAFVLAVAPFAGQKFSLQANPPPYDGTMPQIERHSEQMSFAQQLRDLLLSAQWIQEATPPDDLGVRTGVTTFVPLVSLPIPTGHTIPPLVSAASALSSGLQRLNITAQVVFKKDSPDHVAVIGIGSL